MRDGVREKEVRDTETERDRETERQRERERQRKRDRKTEREEDPVSFHAFYDLIPPLK